MTFYSSQVLLNHIHHLVSMLDFLSSCTVHDHRIPSTAEFVLSLSMFSLYGWAPNEFQLMGLSTITVIAPCSHTAGTEPCHFLFKNCRWFQPWCFPPPNHQYNIGFCWADPIASPHLLTNGLNVNYLWLIWISSLYCTCGIYHRY